MLNIFQRSAVIFTDDTVVTTSKFLFFQWDTVSIKNSCTLYQLGSKRKFFVAITHKPRKHLPRFFFKPGWKHILSFNGYVLGTTRKPLKIKELGERKDEIRKSQGLRRQNRPAIQHAGEHGKFGILQ